MLLWLGRKYGTWAEQWQPVRRQSLVAGMKGLPTRKASSSTAVMNNTRDAGAHHQGNRSNAVAGMRGGLGRILLTAFMLMAIVPLSVVSYLAIHRVQRDMDRTATDRLSRLALSTAAQLEIWLDTQQYGLSMLAHDDALCSAVQQSQWETACSVLVGRSLSVSRYVVEVDGQRKAVCTAVDSAAEAEIPAVEAGIEAAVSSGESRTSLMAYVPLDVAEPVLQLGELSRETRVFAVSPEGHRVLLASEPESDEEPLRWSVT